MPIYTEDIKLLKSAVMADVPEGGGAMTGHEVIDGQSNNLFPDTSTVDRAFGRVAKRKVFGVVQTDDVDMALGAHAIITDAPDDPLVHCTLMAAQDWAEIRSSAQSRVEKYVVKGPRISYRLYDVHYAGSMQVKLVSLVGGTPPAGGDGLVLRNPNGDEQFVRILRTTLQNQTIAVIEGSGTVLLSADVATCTITNELDYDFLGPPAQRVGLIEANWAQIYSTNLAAGAKFYGIKPLALAASPGDYSVTADGGIYSPLVPSATIESPVIDVVPYPKRKTTAPTGYASITAPSITMAVGPGVVLTAPSPISPKSLALTVGAVLFSEVGDGVLLQGAAAVGAVDYGAGTISFGTSMPFYGSAVVSLAYRPATAVAAMPRSQALTITGANQGRAFTAALAPPPAPGTLVLDYMTQGNWYSLSDAGLAGKLSGADAGYGVGTINNETGSMSATLGALPDIGSVLLASYGVGASASAYDPAMVPTALSAVIEAPWDKPIGVVRWTSGGVAKSAIPTAGDPTLHLLQVTPTSRRWRFTPATFPDAGVTVDYTVTTPHSATVITPHTVVTPYSTYFLGNNDATFTLTEVVDTPMAEGSFSALLRFVNPSNAVYPNSVFYAWLYDKGGRVFAVLGTPAGSQTIDLGSIDYTTGQIALLPTLPLPMWLRTYTAQPEGSAWFMPGTYSNHIGSGEVTTSTMSDVQYQIGVRSVTTYTSDEVITYTESTAAWPLGPLEWSLELPSSPSADAINAAVFGLCGTLYTCSAGVLRTGWDVKTGLPLVANAGSLSSGGVLSFSAVPAGGQNIVTWANLTHDVSSGLVDGGVFRTRTAPLKTGVFQLQSGDLIGSANDAGDLTGDYTGSFDALRGVVRWSGAAVAPETLAYNAVMLEYLPLDKSLLGMDTVRLPLDGKVPIYRAGDMLVVHNTLKTQLPNPLVKGTAYSLGRERIASVRVKDALGALVPSSLYTSDLDPGMLTVPTGTSLTPYTQPLTVEHRIEDALVCSHADISGQLKCVSSLTHHFPADTSFVSSALMFGDLLARTHTYIEQSTWTGVWSDERIGSAPLANFNDGQYPVIVTNRGAITERWALIFSNSTTFRIVGETVGDIGTGNTGADCSPINPAAGVPYWTLPVIGLGNGWSAGNVLRFDTSACGVPFWTVRTTLQGPATLQSDVYSLAFRLDVDRP